MYQNWKAAFTACVDKALATAEYKLLQLRECLAGVALKTIEGLGHLPTAYQTAKERLERKFGGQHRQIALYLEEVDNFRPRLPDNFRELEKFADLLDITIVNLKEADRSEELSDGLLYIKLQKKIPAKMLANYHRWIFEKQKKESVETLREWVIQEAEFQTRALEAAHGLSQPRSRRKLLIHTLGSLMPSQMWEYSNHTRREPVECVTNLSGLVQSLSRWLYRAGGNVLNEIKLFLLFRRRPPRTVLPMPKYVWD